ncbi:MAG: hypothetical protein WAQ52_02410 [Terriglobales bacterium]
MTSTSVHQKFSGLLIVIGSLLFVGGGAFHPRINASLGALGSPEFFQNFYMHIAHHPAWELIHGLILAGPVLWLLGVGPFWSDRNGWTRMATRAMTLAATAWAVTFVFDGFVAPGIVRRLAPEMGWYQLAANQEVVIRLGLVAWLMLGFAMIAGSVGTLVSNRSRSARLLAWLGIPLGAWALVAWATGNFLPGPFTSQYWNITAVSTAFWFLAVGVFLLVSAPQSALEPAGEPLRTS